MITIRMIIFSLQQCATLESGSSFYDEYIQLETTGFLPGVHHLASKSTCTMSLHCYYFTHWANYAALCISHLINPHAADRLFLNNFNVHQHCFTSMLDMWNMMSQYLHMTTEHKCFFINTWLGKVYDVSCCTCKYSCLWFF